MAVAEVDAAIERAVNGSYGVCTECDDAIPHARLTANPVAIRCAAYQEKQEERRR
jgi:DnaK suppressor protein